MTKDAWGSVRAGVYLLEVGAADTAAGDLDKDLSDADLRHRHGLDANVVGAMIDGGAHGGRDRLSSAYGCGDGCGAHEGWIPVASAEIARFA